MKKKRRSNIILILIFLAGLFLLLYPTVSNYWNSFHQTRAITEYNEDVAKLDQVDYDRLLEDAMAYNKALLKKPNRYHLSKAEVKEYEKQLLVSSSGIIAYVEIPKIKCRLPIYHGTDEGVMQVAVGHIPGTSLPVGGKSTHCVISSHRGLPSARLFTDLDQMEEGDLFLLRVLDETLTYEVDQIRIVEPEEIQELEIVKGKDYCTLVTCTPYGVNSHRLLVRGHRTTNSRALGEGVEADALQVDPILVAPLVAVPILLALLAWLLIKTRKKKK